MLFNSIEFLYFAIAFFTLFFLTKNRLYFRWVFITIASLFFYGWWNWWYISLILISGLIDYFSAKAVYGGSPHKKKYLILSLFSNLGILCSFKYLGFIKTNLEFIFNTALPEVPHVFTIIPVGISFYTFQSMSYTIDVYQGKLKPAKNIFHFFAYLSMFPQLVAGPIERATDLLPQLENKKLTINSERIYMGIKFITKGLFKKMFVADNLAAFVNNYFSGNLASDSATVWWTVMIAFSLQIYCDFSGYSDIARGLAKWMGLDFNKNFSHPYISQSFSEFWTRWHISLSSWFRDYVYIPLGGNRKGKFRNIANLWATMLISGLWHGASWNFVIWGGLHALYLSIEKAFNIKGPSASLPKRLFKNLVVLFFVVIAWVFFRAETFPQAIEVIQNMFNVSNLSKKGISKDIFIIISIMGIYNFFELFKDVIYLKLLNKHRSKVDMLEPIFLAIVLVFTFIFRGSGHEFIYFQF